jgi:opacity protein-like surface antigen
MSFQARICWPVLTAVVVATAGAPAVADTGFYVGATAGGSVFHQNKNKSDLDAAVINAWDANGFSAVTNSSSLEKSNFAFGGLVGYRLMPEFAIEAAYIDLGKLHYKSDDTVTFHSIYEGPIPIDASADTTVKAKGPTLTALGILPLSPAWEIYGRAGLFFSKVTLNANTTLNLSVMQASIYPYAGAYESVSANSVDPLVGIGTAWHVANRVALRAEYTRFINVGDKNKTGEINIDLFNVGVTYSFY